MDVDNVNFNAVIISSEKRDCTNPCRDGIKNILPIITNKSTVKIKDMEIKIISSLLFMLSSISFVTAYTVLEDIMIF
jgi:hypothetical protein